MIKIIKKMGKSKLSYFLIVCVLCQQLCENKPQISDEMFNTMMVKAKEELKQRHIQYLQQQEEEKRKQAELAEKRKKEEEERIKREEEERLKREEEERLRQLENPTPVQEVGVCL